MTKTGPKKKVDPDYWRGRLDQARAYRERAQKDMDEAGPGWNMSPTASNIVLAAIAYGDALTAKREQVVNQQDHQAAPKLLRDVMGSSLPKAQETTYQRILKHKDSVQYGVRPTSLDQAYFLMKDLCTFGDWLESIL